MATTIKYDGSWSRTAVLFVSHHSGFGPWLVFSLGTPQEELELLRFGPRAPVAIPGGQRSSYDDQKGTSGCHLLQSPPKAGLAYR